MSPEDRALDSFFRNMESETTSLPPAIDFDLNQEDFDKFFERLSTIDDMPWISEPQERNIIPIKNRQAPNPAPAKTGAPPRNAPVLAETEPALPESSPQTAPTASRKFGTGHKKQSAFTTILPKVPSQKHSSPSPEMDDASLIAELREIKSELDQKTESALTAVSETLSDSDQAEAVEAVAAAPTEAETSEASSVDQANLSRAMRPIIPPETQHAIPNRSRIAGWLGMLPAVPTGPVIRFGLGGILLFCLGMAGVWGALSLPSKFEKSMPRIAQVLKRDPSKLVEINPRLNPATSLETSTAKARNSGVLPQAKAPPLKVELIELPVVAASTAGPLKAKPSQQKPSPVPLKELGPSTPLPLAPVSSRISAQQTRPAGSMALQVGACSSYRCVENFRKLLIKHIASEKIQVVKSKGGGQRRDNSEDPGGTS